jgi:response regulator RpfG family c-di-GMP phosphodiesterase
MPILLIIDHHQKAQLAHCIRLGITDYIITPVLPEELLLKVQRVQGALNKLPLPVSTQDVRDVAVQLVRRSIELWQKYSSKSKVDLAESSRLWRVYVDGSTAKTRTLDKYLSLQSLPKNPRWETVSRTAAYVLEECDLDEKDNKSLSQQLSLFKKLLAN